MEVSQAWEEEAQGDGFEIPGNPCSGRGSRMILRELRLKNYRRFKDTYLSDFPESIIAILGRNGIGKSTILEAVSWVLFGSTAFRTDKADVKRQGAAPEDSCEVNMVFSLRGKDYEILREIKGKNNIVRASAWVYENGMKKVVANSERGVSEYCQNILGMDWQTFQASFFSQEDYPSASGD
jgi:DNA repair exonuclease SbcCD ATPase subunit